MPGNTLASQTMYLNFVHLLFKLASDCFKDNQLLSELTHAHYREPVDVRLSRTDSRSVIIAPLIWLLRCR